MGHVRLLPDKPKTKSPAILPTLDREKYTALTKLDGWGVLIEIYEDIKFVSRTGEPLPVSEEVWKTVQSLRDKIPPNSTLWGEWMKMRPEYDGPECIYILSPMILAGEFVGHLSHKARFDWVDGLGIPIDDMEIKRSDQMPDHKLIIPNRSSNVLELFEASKSVPRTEGVVIYKNDGVIYGSPTGCVKNDTMWRCKWRSGDDGRTRVA